MGRDTAIQWCDDTINPTMGCDGCELWSAGRKTCYAGVLHRVRGGHNKGFAPTFEQVTLFPGRMGAAARWPDLTGMVRTDKPWLNGLPRHIFVSDMSDALSKAVSFDYLEQEVISTVISEAGWRHRWLWLTKRPARMARFSRWLAERGIEWPVNLWAGTSITSQRTTRRIGPLLSVGGERTTRFLSVEPQVEPIDLGRWLPRLDWVIQGGESGGKARPFDVSWAVGLLRQCRESGVPYFLKQLGAFVVMGGQRRRLTDRHGGDWSEWPEAIRVRQMPIP
jgi:protein gp37